MSSESNTSPRGWVIASAWLATNCFAFNMSSFGYYSFWVIPSALVVTCFHHGYLLRYLSRNPGQPSPRKYLYTLPFLSLFWAAGGGISFWTGSWTLPQHTGWWGRYGELQIAVSTLIGGVLSMIEAGLVVEVWRRCAKLKTNGTTNALPLGSLDKLDRQVAHGQAVVEVC